MKLLKLPLFAELLKTGSVFVFVMPSPEIVLPKNLIYPLALEYGYNMPNPIPDLSWSERGIRATLSFNTVSHETFVPWESVVAMRPSGQDAIVQWAWTSRTGAAQLSVDATINHPTPPPVATQPKLSIVR
jgi:hypothetical protein